MQALCPQHREKTVTAGCSHEPCNALHKQSRCSRRFSVSHPHKENCVQLINYAFKRINDKNAIIRLAKDNGRSIHILFIDKSARRKHNVRCVCLSEIICMCMYVSSLTLKSIFYFLYFFVCLLLLLTNTVFWKCSMSDVTKGSGTIPGFETSDRCLFHHRRPCHRPTALHRPLNKRKVQQSIRFSGKLKAVISAEDCNPRLNMQSDNCARLPHWSEIDGIMRGLQRGN